MNGTASLAGRIISPRAPVRIRADADRTADWLVGISLAGDTFFIFSGLLLGFWIRFQSGWGASLGVEQSNRALSEYFGLIVIGTGLLQASFGALRLYDRYNLLRYRRIGLTIIKGSTFWFFAYLGISLALKFEPPISRVYVVSSYICSLGLLLIWRYVYFKIIKTGAIGEALRQRVVFIGWNAEADRLVSEIEADSRHPYRIAGCITSPSNTFQFNPPPNVRRMGDYSHLEQLFKERRADIAVLVDLDQDKEKILSLANLCEKEFVQFKVIPSYFQIMVSGLQLETISGVPILGVTELPLGRLLSRIVKRCVDILGSLVGLIVSVPVVFVCGLFVFLESPGPVFYRQTRIGRNGREFKIIKIRSMKLNAESQGGAQWAKEADPRRLKIGAFMREWNLDEVPQFWNVLKGEMSLVGPRPERPELIEDFKHEIPHYNSRHVSKPGITGWAQVNGLRGNTSLEERIRYDIYYLENWSLWMDFQIIMLTFLKRENAY